MNDFYDCSVSEEEIAYMRSLISDGEIFGCSSDLEDSTSVFGYRDCYKDYWYVEYDK